MRALFFLMLPSILPSEFMFPFGGMLVWTQLIGEVLPATHFMRIVRRGVMLRGAGPGSVSVELAALLAIRPIVSTLAISRHRVMLD
ncbi:MAG TPA: hypothetical protein VK777_07615 [Reyranella sp.]|jgi:ABC-2 type transport system permease protein|nr:hypothetical protein [Reyranella sp.]